MVKVIRAIVLLEREAIYAHAARQAAAAAEHIRSCTRADPEPGS